MVRPPPGAPPVDVRRLLWVGAIASLAALALFTAMSLLWTHTFNYGHPRGYGIGRSRQVHRHDFGERYGWPFRCYEHQFSNWYVYTPGGVRPASSEEKRQWLAALRAETRTGFGYFSPGARERYMRNPTGDMRFIIWPGIYANTTLVLFAGILTAVIVNAIIIMRRRKRRADGCCVQCGYDLRASGESGRCPECGTLIDTTSW